MRTSVYIDGFNLFYGILKKSPYKWLDLKALCLNTLPNECELIEINYYTAMVKGAPGKAERQNIYFEALRNHIPEFRYVLGWYQIQAKELPEAIQTGTDRRGKPVYRAGKKVLVLKREEKKTDVNIATEMLNDAWRNKFDCAVLISNDSDLAPALLATKQRGKIIGIATTTVKPTGNLQKLADFHRHITKHIVKYCQLPERIQVKESHPARYLTKPAGW
jgi:uncharacterized LabA/DUF88 family protein